MNITFKDEHKKNILKGAGIGLRAPHYQDIIDHKPNIGWFEIHSENYFGKGGKPHYYLEQIRQDYPFSFHGVGLSLGSVDALNMEHLQTLKNIILRFEPTLVSEHLSWSSINGRYFNDLLPLPYTSEVLTHLVSRIHQVQDFLQRTILIENISSYLQYHHSNIPEAELMREIAAKTGCGILLDVNNLYVNSQNHGMDTASYLQTLTVGSVQEIHLAGFTQNHFTGGSILIDTH
ncbi:MAG: DUF692 domain-containing protein, partial [Candidatus Berkiellales bacterium]